VSTKASLRRHFRPLRQSLLEGVEAAIVAQARRHIPALLPAGRALGLYWPLPGEVDLRELEILLPGRLALPAIVPRSPPALA
jgi:5-formyltetrahydrofolate cyclo-ligase